VPLEHALSLVKHLVQMKTTNLELEAYVKEMQAKLRENGVPVPSMVKPEKTGLEKKAKDSVLSDDDFSGDSYDSDDSENLDPVAGKGLLE